MKKYILFIILMVILGGCASYQPPKEYKFDKTRTYNQKYDDIWDKTVKYCTDNNIPLKSMDKNSGLIVSEYNLNDRLKGCYDCGELASLQDFEDFSAVFNIVIKKENDMKTTVIITVYYKTELVVQSFSYKKLINCNSTGKLEKEIFDYLEQGDKLPKN